MKLWRPALISKEKQMKKQILMFRWMMNGGKGGMHFGKSNNKQNTKNRGEEENLVFIENEGSLKKRK